MRRKFLLSAVAVLFAWQYAGGAQMEVTSSAFDHNGRIPVQYTCKGADQSPALRIEGIPPGTQSLVLIVDDPDAPMGTFVHWVVYNIPPSVASIETGASVPGDQGYNSAGRTGYMGPCPPSGTHRYFFKVYALDARIEPGSRPDKAAVEKAMAGHIIGEGQIMGQFSK